VKGLAAELGWEPFQEAGAPLHYLADVARDPPRWAFEAQTAFLVSKAEALIAHAGARSLIVDRSLYEDAEVFARAWHELGALDARAYATYRRLYGLLRDRVPPPDVLILCDCAPATCEARLSQRRQPLDDFWRGEALRTVDRILREWWTGLRGDGRFELDTERWDCRAPRVVDAVAADVRAWLDQGEGAPMRVLTRTAPR
jgi:deoxyadenosine/deoxycytidine kinase